ncbi:MAG: hypothetical protein LBB05_01040 [Puniceicoccales bacterium]|nr:hypothetical protein [Puniceicoccales bacterium]
MRKKILWSLLISVGAMLNGMAAVPEECKNFFDRITNVIERIEKSPFSNQEKVEELVAVMNRIAGKMNKKPKKSKRTKNQKDQDSVAHKRLDALYNKVQEILKKYQ